MQEAEKKMASIEEKMDTMIQYLSSINYLLLYGNQVQKDQHYEELNKRIGVTSIPEHHQSYQSPIL